MNKKQLYLAINKAGKESLIGPKVVSKLIISPDFFRKESWISFKENLSINENNILVERSIKKLVEQELYLIPVHEITKEGKEDYKVIISLLNSTLKFWDYDILIHSSIEPDQFIKELKQVLPLNLKKKINEIKFVITSDKNRYLSLSKSYAEYYLNKEMMELKSIWGDFGTGKKEDKKTIDFIKNTPKCPHIRKEVK